MQTPVFYLSNFALQYHQVCRMLFANIYRLCWGGSCARKVRLIGVTFFIHLWLLALFKGQCHPWSLCTLSGYACAGIWSCHHWGESCINSVFLGGRGLIKPPNDLDCLSPLTVNTPRHLFSCFSEDHYTFSVFKYSHQICEMLIADT